jgi:hypothetical protein
LAAKIEREREGAFLDYMGDRVFWRPTTPLEVEELCGSLDTHEGTGWNEVSLRVIKTVAHEISRPLSFLFNCCMRGGHYLAFFRVAQLVPVFKSEDPTEYSNYSPVSELPVLSQVFERLLQGRLLEFLDHQGVVIPGQYGFRSGHSTAMAVMNMVERVREAWRKKIVALGVFIDLKKAFDTVDHRILLAKLEHYGVRGEALGLLESYLRDRSQYVVYNRGESGRRGLECRVPQGSVLGPLFFLFYVNDMARTTVELGFVLFADDTNLFADDMYLFAEGQDPARLFERVNGGLSELGRWFRCNRLTINLNQLKK